MYLVELDQKLDQKHLLKHPFYKAWSAGMLTLEHLRIYAAQYFYQVLNFPRYLSATLSQCTDPQAQQILLENLIEEAYIKPGKCNHPQYFLQFAQGLGLTEEQIKTTELFPETQALIDCFMTLAYHSYASGLGALYAYERQIPQTAASKISGLKQFYDIDDETTLQFFNIHLYADVAHAQESRDLIMRLPKDDYEDIDNAALKVVDGLWGLLDGIGARTLGNSILC